VTTQLYGAYALAGAVALVLALNNRYAVLPLFALLGLVLPWQDWAAFGPVALVFVAGVLLVRRPPVVLAHSHHEGVTHPRLFAAGTLAVAASVLAAGVTSSPLRRHYQARDA
jgi:NhaP-type Na+/H+ or K+/H+ antiporter